MRIDVVGRNIEVTDPIRTYAEAKAGKLTKYFENKVQAITVHLSKTSHAHHGEFEAELVIDVEHHDDFVSHATGKDTYAAIDLVVEKGERQLREFKEQVRHRKH
jgi:ribosomal subunit interface protein